VLSRLKNQEIIREILQEMEKKKVTVPLVCHGHSRPVVDLFYSPVTPDGFFLISASKGIILLFFDLGIVDFDCFDLFF